MDAEGDHRGPALPEGTKTVPHAAAAIGVDVGQIVKSLIFAVDGEVVLAYVSGVNQLDEKKLAAAAGGRKASRVDADVVREATGYPIGGVPPFGHATPLRVFIDPDLLQCDVVWAAAGTWNDVFPIEPHELGAGERRRGRRPPPRLTAGRLSDGLAVAGWPVAIDGRRAGRQLAAVTSSRAWLSVFHARVAHLMRTGNFTTPRSASRSPSFTSASSAASSAVAASSPSRALLVDRHHALEGPRPGPGPRRSTCPSPRPTSSTPSSG